MVKRVNAFFEELFPSHKADFDLTPLTSDEWKEGLAADVLSRRWHRAIWADDLLKACASHREATDLFIRYKFSNRLALFREAREVATKRKTKVTDERPEWRGFLDKRMSDEELAACDEWQPTPSEVWELVDGLLLTDYRVTLSYNRKMKLANCTIIDDSPERKSGGYALSSADSDGALALKLALFKHYQILGTDWLPLLAQPSVGGRRG